jgi:hypothetical protein
MDVFAFAIVAIKCVASFERELFCNANGAHNQIIFRYKDIVFVNGIGF